MDGGVDDEWVVGRMVLVCVPLRSHSARAYCGDESRNSRRELATDLEPQRILAVMAGLARPTP